MRKKTGVKPPGPGILTSTKRKTELIATNTPSKAIIFALTACPCISNSKARKHSAIKIVTNKGALDAFAPFEGVPKAADRKGCNSASRPMPAVNP